MGVEKVRHLSAFLLQLDGYGETSADLHRVAFDCAEQGSNNDFLGLGASDVMVEDGWDNARVHNGLESFD